MDAGPLGEGRRRGKKNRGRSNRRKRSKGRGNRGYQHNQEKFPVESHLDDRSILGGRIPKISERKTVLQEDGPPDAFRIFCAYCLGITPNDGYHKPHLEDVAKRFNIAPKELRDLVVEFGLDDETLKRCSFDLVGAQMDIRVAPEGMSRTELARDLYQELVEAKATVK